jgi:hypothetical protein
VAGGRDGGRRLPDRWEAVEAGTTPRGAMKSSDEVSQRLAKGALGDMVRDYLATHHEEPLGPSAIGKALGKSEGAVSNALERFVAGGIAVRTSDHPRRYLMAGGSSASVVTTATSPDEVS